MDYKLFDDYITLQALLKELGIIQSGGAIKGFLAEKEVLFNGESETRRGKKLRIGDTVSLPEQELEITVVAPTADEIVEHAENLAEKERVTALVKQMNQANKKVKKQVVRKSTKSKNAIKSNRKPIRFPGT